MVGATGFEPAASWSRTLYCIFLSSRQANMFIKARYLGIVLLPDFLFSSV